MTTEGSNNGTSLTTKQQRFVEEYCVDFNATQAAVRAGYAKKSASAEGSRQLKNVKVFASIRERLDALSMTAEEATLWLSMIARREFSDDDIRPEHALSALDKLMRFYGRYNDHGASESQGDIIVSWKLPTPEEIEAAIAPRSTTDEGRRAEYFCVSARTTVRTGRTKKWLKN